MQTVITRTCTCVYVYTCTRGDGRGDYPLRAERGWRDKGLEGGALSNFTGYGHY